MLPRDRPTSPLQRDMPENDDEDEFEAIDRVMRPRGAGPGSVASAETSLDMPLYETSQVELDVSDRGSPRPPPPTYNDACCRASSETLHT